MLILNIVKNICGCELKEGLCCERVPQEDGSGPEDSDDPEGQGDSPAPAPAPSPAPAPAPSAQCKCDHIANKICATTMLPPGFGPDDYCKNIFTNKCTKSSLGKDPRRTDVCS